MKPEEAREIVASYLTGGKIAFRRLEGACRALAVDQEYVEFLRTVHGTESHPATGCREFRERMAEFVDATPDERRREMPELVEHVTACPACLSTYWRVRACWLPGGPDAATGTSWQTLAEPLEAVRLADGELSGRGLGRRWLAEEEPTHALAMEADEGASTAKRWRIEDEAAGIVVVVELAAEADGGVLLTCRCDTAAGAPEAGALRIEVRRSDGPLPVVDAALEDQAGRTVRLDVGEWRIRIWRSGVDRPAGWEISLVVSEE